MKTLSLVSLKQPLDIAQTATAVVSLTSAATSVMRDFTTTTPLLIEDSTPVKDATLILQRAHVHFKLVIDNTQRLVGTLSYSQVSQQQLMIKQGEGFDLDSLTVKDVMAPIETLEALEYSELKKSTVSHLLNTLHQYGLENCLVLDSPTNTIRGVIIAEEIARKINAPIPIRSKPNFVDLFKELHIH